MLYCEMKDLFPFSDIDIRCEDCPDFSFCPVVMDDYPCLEDVEDVND